MTDQEKSLTDQIREAVTGTNVDLEAGSLNIIVTVLDNLPDDACGRVMRYLNDRYQSEMAATS